MPPIKLYTNSPINAAKAEGITPKTAAPSNDESGGPGTEHSGVQNQIHAPLQPTPTTTREENHPPPPQPGARPVPYPQPTQTQTATATTSGQYAPPAPATTQPAVLPGGSHGGGGNQNTYPTPTHAPQPPPQLGMSLVDSTAPHTYRGTSTATAPTGATNAAAPLTGSGGRYVGYGAAGNYAGGRGGGNVGYSPPAGGPSGYQQRADTNSSDRYRDDGGDEEGVWNSAVKWAQAAGEKLSAAESEVWKRINKE
ncbi:hypothetical protein V8F20_008748 [Naviculisporaceae sp. PSN 640]